MQAENVPNGCTEMEGGGGWTQSAAESAKHKKSFHLW